MEQQSYVQNDIQRYVKSSNSFAYFQSPPPNKNSSIPGYQGYLPQVRNLVAKTYTKESRYAMKPDVVERSPNRFSTTGFNWRVIPKHDETLHAVHHKYGKTTIMDTHPDIKGDVKTTTTAKTYRAPQTRVKPNWRERVKNTEICPEKT